MREHIEREELSIRQCKEIVYPSMNDCEGEIKFHTLYQYQCVNEGEVLLYDVWVCKSCDNVIHLEEAQKRIGDY